MSKRESCVLLVTISDFERWGNPVKQKEMARGEGCGKGSTGHRATPLGKEIKFMSKISLKSRKSCKLANK